MNKFTLLISFFILCFGSKVLAKECFPDGKPIAQWFKENRRIDISILGKVYRITDYGVSGDSTLLQTDKIQAVIDRAAEAGGGVIVIPRGVFLSSSLFFKQDVHLHLEEGAVLKGSDDISDYPVIETRMEGQTLKYFPALVNADSVDGFTISGKGTLDGNGLRYWKSFWQRRKVNHKCTNMEELRPRVIYISRSNHVQIEGIHVKNSPFWSTHYYKCNWLKLIDLHITSPENPVKAPSTDAIDLDVCDNVLVKGCYLSVNDDAIALKGGKGPWADQDANNGGNSDILIEDCTFGFSHSMLTCGSETIHNRNILLRRCMVDGPKCLLNLKMRPDTPQHNEYIRIEDVKGKGVRFLQVAPWRQFFDLKGHKDLPMATCEHVTIRNVDANCQKFFAVSKSEQYVLRDFIFENLHIEAADGAMNPNIIERFTMKDVMVNGKRL